MARRDTNFLQQFQSFYLFPVHGITLNDLPSIPSYLWFDNGALVTRKQVRSLLSIVQPTRYHDISKSLLEEFYILVSFNKPDEDFTLLQTAYRRAQEIITGFAIPIFVSSSFTIMPCLGMEIYSDSGDDNRYLLDRRGNFKKLSRSTKNQFFIRMPNNFIKFNKTFIKKFLNREPHCFFANLMLYSKDQSNLSKLIRESAINFYQSINTQSLVYQFLGTFTSIEILLSSGNHDKIKSRSKVLLESHYDNYFLLNEDNPKNTLLNLRNSISHKGEVCSVNDVNKAIHVATLLLYKCSFLLPYFDNKEILCSYLDLLTLAKQHENNITNTQFDIIKQWEFIYHKRTTSWDCVETRLTQYFDLNHLNKKSSNDVRLYFATAVYDLSKLRQISIQAAYHKICRWIWNNEPLFSTIEELQSYLDEHRSEVEKYSQASSFISTNHTP